MNRYFINIDTMEFIETNGFDISTDRIVEVSREEYLEQMDLEAQ